METAKEHGLQLNMASDKTEAVVDFTGKARQQVVEDFSREFLVIDGKWTPTDSITEDTSLRLVSQYRHLGTQATHGARRGPELATRRPAARAAYHATRKQILNPRRFSKTVRAAVARAVIGSQVVLRCQRVALLSATDTNVMEDAYLSPFRTMRWRPGHVPASSQQVCRRLGILDFQEAVDMERLPLAARLVNTALSLVALLQSFAGRAWKDDLARDLALFRQEMGGSSTRRPGNS